MAHSELLLREIFAKDHSGTDLPKRDNVSLYPLNSMYLRKLYAAHRKDEPHAHRNLGKMESFLDLLWLWEERIKSEVEEWRPELVIVSYNGQMSIPEEDFDAIIKDLTAIT